MQMNAGNVTSALDMMLAIRETVSTLAALDTAQVQGFVKSMQDERAALETAIRVETDSRIAATAAQATAQKAIDKLEALKASIEGREGKVSADEARVDKLAKVLAEDDRRVAASQKALDQRSLTLDALSAELDRRADNLRAQEEGIAAMRAEVQRRLDAIKRAAEA